MPTSNAIKVVTADDIQIPEGVTVVVLDLSHANRVAIIKWENVPRLLARNVDECVDKT